MLNAYGEVIGINTAVRSDAQNIGFSIPINRLRDLIPELMNPASASKVDVPIHMKEKRESGAAGNDRFARDDRRSPAANCHID